jgi:hypothetical protein
LTTVFVARNRCACDRAANQLRVLGLLSDARELRRVFELLLKSPDPVSAKKAMCLAFALAVGIPLDGLSIQSAPFTERVPLPKAVDVPLADGKMFQFRTQ